MTTKAIRKRKPRPKRMMEDVERKHGAASRITGEVETVVVDGRKIQQFVGWGNRRALVR